MPQRVPSAGSNHGKSATSRDSSTITFASYSTHMESKGSTADGNLSTSLLAGVL